MPSWPRQWLILAGGRPPFQRTRGRAKLCQGGIDAKWLSNVMLHSSSFGSRGYWLTIVFLIGIVTWIFFASFEYPFFQWTFGYIFQDDIFSRPRDDFEFASIFDAVRQLTTNQICNLMLKLRLKKWLFHGFPTTLSREHQPPS